MFKAFKERCILRKASFNFLDYYDALTIPKPGFKDKTLIRVNINSMRTYEPARICFFGVSGDVLIDMWLTLKILWKIYFENTLKKKNFENTYSFEHQALSATVYQGLILLFRSRISRLGILSQCTLRLTIEKTQHVILLWIVVVCCYVCLYQPTIVNYPTSLIIPIEILNLLPWLFPSLMLWAFLFTCLFIFSVIFVVGLVVVVCCANLCVIWFNIFDKSR